MTKGTSQSPNNGKAKYKQDEITSDELNKHREDQISEISHRGENIWKNINPFASISSHLHKFSQNQRC